VRGNDEQIEALAWERERRQGGRKSGRSEPASETGREGREEERRQRLSEGREEEQRRRGRKSGGASGERVRSGPTVGNSLGAFRKNVQGPDNPGRREYLISYILYIFTNWRHHRSHHINPIKLPKNNPRI
jgi:hypothetical protein